jgi:hypothetical protein
VDEGTFFSFGHEVEVYGWGNRLGFSKECHRNQSETSTTTIFHPAVQFSHESTASSHNSLCSCSWLNAKIFQKVIKATTE